MLKAMLQTKLAKARATAQPNERLENAAAHAADCQVRKDRAEKHLNDAKENFQKTQVAFQEAMDDLETVKAERRGKTRPVEVRTPSKAYLHAALMVQHLRGMGTAQGESFVVPAAAVQELEARLRDRSAWTPNRTSTPRQLSQPHPVQRAAPMDQRRVTPERRSLQHDMAQNMRVEADTEAERYDIGEGQDDHDMGEVDMSTPVGSDREGVHASSDPGEPLGRMLRSRLHPTSGRRSSKKSAVRNLTFQSPFMPASKFHKPRAHGNMPPPVATHR